VLLDAGHDALESVNIFGLCAQSIWYPTYVIGVSAFVIACETSPPVVTSD
jgi:hypothetical protein